VQAVIPVHVLPPGSYLARATVVSGGRTVGKLTRPFEVRRSAAARDAAAGTAVVASMAVRGTDGARFRREDILHQEVAAYFLDALASARAAAPPEVKAAIAAARGGKLQGAGRQAFEAGDQLAAAFLRGLELFTAGQIEPAATQFRAATTVAPTFAPAAFYLGACFAAAGRDREAGALWGRALPAGAPAVVYEQIADLWIRLNDGARAVAALKEGTKLWPDRPSLQRRLGLAYAATGDHAAALVALDPYLAKNPSDAEALFVAVLALYEAKAAGKPAGTPEQDTERASRYARAYRAANGPQQALVSKWADFVAESAASTR
jgi:tetratricopeptide (TPR) repeat protein